MGAFVVFLESGETLLILLSIVKKELDVDGSVSSFFELSVDVLST